ncbi:MAG TPA: crossover junction endodeoxyribonuclease RuvC [Tepidisphaeraceae bacterium]|nr:crossover junction endodeoxyribonuclease RuvC [Tepidisphaeraceae bacterium]
MPRSSSKSVARSPRRILGLDPGLQLTGYGVIDLDRNNPTIVDAGVIRLNPKTSIADRLVELEHELSELISEHEPTEIAVEQLYSHYKHPRTAILMGHARGVILLCAARSKVPIAELAANRVKQSLTGHGHASKPQMQRAIQSVFKLPEPPNPPDIADALAIALCQSREVRPV